MVNGKSRVCIDSEINDLWNILSFCLDGFPVTTWMIIGESGIESEEQLKDISFTKLYNIVNRLEEVCPNELWARIPQSAPKKIKPVMIRKPRSRRSFRNKNKFVLYELSSSDSSLKTKIIKKSSLKLPSLWVNPE